MGLALRLVLGLCCLRLADSETGDQILKEKNDLKIENDSTGLGS